jgi:hypothetical protein
MTGITTWIRFAVLGGIAVVVAVFLGWQTGQISVPAIPPPAAIAWVLPSRQIEDSARDLAILSTRRPWTDAFLAARSAAPGAAGARQPGAAQPSGAKPAVWRLAGIGQRPGEKFALIAIGEGGAVKLEYRRIGDLLPDGSTLVQITPDNAVAEPAGTSGEQRVYWLFRRKS